MKNCLVYETLNQVSELKIEESKTPNTVRLSGIFGVCGIKNGNNRIYEKANYGKMVEALQNVIATEGCPGELEHPNSMNINLENVSHKIESIQMNEDGTITGTIVLLNTPKGKIAQALVEGGLPLFISSRGAGSIDESGHVTLSTIKTYDLVGTPGFSQAKLNLAENQTFECLNESLCVVTEKETAVKDVVEEAKKEEDSKEEPKEDVAEEPKEDSKEEASEKDSKEEPKEEPKEEKSENDDDDSDDEKDTKNKKDEKTSDNDDMNEIKETVDFLKKEVEDLKAQLHVAQESLEEANDQIQELSENQSSVDYDAIESWIKEEFAPEFKSEINENVQDWVVNEFAPEVQNWVTEEFAPEVQNWICEEFAPEVQNWICEEFAPVIDNWICEEHDTEMSNSIQESMKSWCKDDFAKEVYESINEYMESKSDDVFKSVDSMLMAVEGKSNTEEAAKAIDETLKDRWSLNPVVAGMPINYKPLWNMCSESKKEEICSRAKIYDFTKAGVMESFWSSVDFTETAPAQVNENKSNYSAYESNVINSFKRMNHKF